MSNNNVIIASYDKDTFKCHRYLIEEGQVIKGTLYIPKDIEKIPERVIIQLKVKGE